MPNPPENYPDDFLPTRSSLLQRLKTWNNDADWKEFFDTYQRSIHGLAMKCGLSHAEAQEVVQETMLSVAKKMPEFEYDRSVGTFKGWLFTITRRAVGKQFAKRGRSFNAVQNENPDPESLAELETIPDPAADFEKRWEQDWRHSVVEMAMDRVRRRVSPKQFQIFDLVVNQHLPMEQVIQLLNVNTAQVYMAKMRVSRAVRREIAALEKKLI
jgi:RNA polymerase sigma factor (sigma-70 family)